MRCLIPLLLLVAVTLIGCGQQKFDSHADGALGFHRVTNQQTSDVRQQCGTVGSADDPLQMSGWSSGTKLFLVSNESVSKEVAVQLQDGHYVLVMYVGNKKT